MKKQPIYYAAQRPKMIPFVPKEAKVVLEVGCDAGGFSSQFMKKGEEDRTF